MAATATLKDPVTVSPAIIVRSLKSVLTSAFNLGVGEAVSNFASFLLFAYLSRHYGVELLGIVALAQTVARYVTLGTDQGLRLVGARLVARNGAAAPLIVKRVLLKRLFSCATCVTVGCTYALYGPVPQSARSYILGFVLGVVPYAFSLDWLAWGLDKFAWLGVFRGGVTVLFLIGSITGIVLARTTLWALTLANGLAATLGAVGLWTVWLLRWKPQLIKDTPALEGHVHEELRWLAILPLGMTMILNQAFHNFDTVLLGAMSTASEVGRYSSAYRILFFILGGYWLVTTSLYPRLSRARGGPQAKKLLLWSLLAVATAGTLLALVIGIFAPNILALTYGSDLGATNLLRILVFAIPMDFCVALLTVVFVSRGLDRTILTAIGTAAGMNIVLNLCLIPRFQGLGAAVATLASYLYLVSFLLQHTIRKPVFATDITPLTATAI